MLAGIIQIFAGSTAPAGYLICDGSAVSRTTYATLFDAIGTTFGSGDGSTTFNIPDLSGRVAMGVSQSHAIATTGGAETVSLTDIPNHTHTVPSHGHANTIAATTPSYTHTVSTQPAFNYNRPNSTGTRYGVYSGQATRTAYTSTSSVNATLSTSVAIAKHPATSCTMGGSIADCAAFDTESTGTGDGHNNMQPFVTMNYVISTGE